MSLPGGAADKLGNRYERLWTAYQLLGLLDGRCDSIRLEEPGVDKAEFVIRRGDRQEFHQVKCAGMRARWSVASLAAEGVGVLPADRTNNRSKRDGCEVRLIDGALGGSLQRRPLSPLRMWRWMLETERSRETAVTWVAVAAWRQAVVFYGSLSWYRAAGCSVLSGGALAWVVVAASRARGSWR